jgi:NAD(P)H-flavin reductase
MPCTCQNEYDNIFAPREVEILSAKMMTETEKHFELRLKDGSRFEFEPGQIVEAGLFGFGEIPLGLSSSPTKEGSFELVVRQVGKVSTALLKLEKGDSLYIRGPMGHGFPLAELRGHDVLVVAAGIGLCPTRSLIRYILDRRSEFTDFTLFFGARNPKLQLFTDDLAEWRCSTDVKYLETVDQADENWKGNVGVITTLFAKSTNIAADTRVIICGPPIMYKFVIKELDKLSVPHSNIYVDLERRMKCGLGKCGHCQINNVYVCKDGPVFRYSDIQELPEAI